jgi:hypothetical protein
VLSNLSRSVFPWLNDVQRAPDERLRYHSKQTNGERARTGAGVDRAARDRHCARLLIASGAKPKVISKVMEHAIVGMTFNQCGYLMPGGFEAAAAAANAFLSRAVGA